MKGFADGITSLDNSKGGIPETRINKNRSALFVFDPKKHQEVDIYDWFHNAVDNLINGKIDTIVIDVKERKW